MVPRGRGPRSGLVGWAAAWTVLERIRDEPLRDLLDELARRGGVATAPGLRYLAQLLVFHAAKGDYPSPPGFKAFELEFIQRRAKELLEPYVGDARCKHLRGVTMARRAEAAA